MLFLFSFKFSGGDFILEFFMLAIRFFAWVFRAVQGRVATRCEMGFGLEVERMKPAVSCRVLEAWIIFDPSK